MTNTVKIPTPVTLAKYGLHINEWQRIHDAQQGVCGACGKLPPSGRLVIDHEHVRGWKHMAPEIRKTYVRGLLCWTCNLYTLGRGADIARLKGALNYLIRYHMRAS